MPVEAMLKQAADLTESYRLERAAEIYRHLLAQKPDLVDGLVGLAATLARQSDLHGAFELYRQALRLHPQSAVISHRLAVACELAGLFDEALAGNRRVVKLNPGLLRARCRLATLRERICDWDRRDEEKQAIADTLKRHFLGSSPGKSRPIEPWSLLTLPLSPAEVLALARSYSVVELESLHPLRARLPAYTVRRAGCGSGICPTTFATPRRHT